MNLSVETSPFVFDRPVPPDDLVGRHTELAALRDRAVHGRHVMLVAPRRFGKTSIVHRLARDGAATGDLHVVHVDLLGVQTVGDVARRYARAVRALPADGALRRAVEALVRHAPDLAATLGWGAVSVTVRPAAAPPPQETLESLLDLPAQAADRLRATVLVVLDEFQDIVQAEGADATIRSVIQHQAGIAYLFAGSAPSTMEAIFSDPRRALYAQAERIALGPLPDAELGSFIDDRFASTGRGIEAGTLAELLAVVAGHPQRSMLVAHHLWSLTEDGAVADRDRLAEAMGATLTTFAYEGSRLLSELTVPQAKVARLIAHGQPVRGSAGAALELAKSTASQALASLRRDWVVSGDPPRLVDPLFAEWLRRELPLTSP